MTNSRITDLFAYQVQRRGRYPAVHAWDGELSYAQLDERSSQLAAWLIKNDIAGPGRIVPLCFDKTVWTTITLLAVAKAGSIFIMLDPRQPFGRLKSIMQQIQSTTILARHDTAKLARSLAESTIIVDEDLLQHGDKLASVQIPAFCGGISPSDRLYIVFTSGSTGTPKGVTISHANLCTAVGHQARALGFDTGVRTFDSSSYSFDAYVCNTFHTILTGGCLCVPSDNDRINNLQSVLQSMDVEFVQLTPSTSRLLDPSKLPRLHTLILTGEKINRNVLEPWLETAGRVRVINAYGPSECTIMCAANRNINCIKDAESVGFSLGANLWIADVHNIHRLAPVGAVGELLIDGPIIGQGYFGDERKTQESLVDVPGGYLPGIALAPESPIFRTRDLARYNVDGSISFIGRADTQIKINGQRVEIGEVEYHVGQCLPEGVDAIVEAVDWPSGQKQLLAFIYLRQDKGLQLSQLITKLDEKLSDRLPRFMIPSAYFPLRTVPMTATGKTDRKVLRRMALVAPDQLLNVHALPGATGALPAQDADRPMTSVEITLQWLWAEVLTMNNDAPLLPSDNFFARGGDSLAAMRLVSALRREGCSNINVADIFRHPRLCDMAISMGEATEQASPDANATQKPLSPFSMLLGDAPDAKLIELTRNKISKICKCEALEIEDVFPCSSIQEEMVILGARNPEDFVTQTVFPLPPGVDLSRFQRAWENVTRAAPIIRTRIVDTKMALGDVAVDYDHVFSQVIFSGQVPWTEYSDLDECLKSERGNGMGLGEPLMRLGIVGKAKSQEQQRSRLQAVLTMHHAVYDGWSMDLLGKDIAREYYASEDSKVSDDSILPYRNFIQHLHTLDQDLASRFWTRYLKDAHLRPFPTLPVPNYRPNATALQDHVVSGIEWTKATGITANTIVQTAWGMVLSKHSGASEVVFGATLLGRQIPLAGIERVGGPTIATVPMRVVVDWDGQSALEILQRMQDQAAEMIPFVHHGIKRIRKLGYDMQRACQFQTFFVVQPVSQSEVRSAEKALFDLGDGRDDIQAFNTYAIMVDCGLARDGFHLRASFDETILGKNQVQQMLSDMENVVRSLITESEKPIKLRDMGILTDEERAENLSFSQQGQGSQLNEIESCIKGSLPEQISDAAVDVVELPSLSKQLVAFVCLAQSEASPAQSNTVLANLIELLGEKLPSHMTPSHFLLLPNIPKLASGDVDREEVYRIALQKPTHELVNRSTLISARTSNNDPPRTQLEILLQGLWATTLGVEKSQINRNTSFLALGGDSLRAMQLVAAAREEGYSLSVAKVLRTPRLSDMAVKALEPLEGTQSSLSDTIEPFSLLDKNVTKEALAKACNLQPDEIEDAYPCSPIQDMMLVHTARRDGEFVSQGYIHLPAHVDIAQLKAAWIEVIAANPILRTRIVEFAGQGLLQVVTKTTPVWLEYDTLEEVQQLPVGLGEHLLWFALVKSPSALGTRDGGTTTENATLVMTIHHAIYDRWSASLVMKAVESIYRGESLAQTLLPYNQFIQYLGKNVDADSCQQFWEKYLADCNVPQFPVLPNPKYRPTTTGVRKRRLDSIAWPKDFTPATTLKAGWAVLVSQFSNSSDVVFGSTVMGRQAPLAGVERIAGPTIATVPIRVKIDWNLAKLQTLLQTIQSDATDMIPFEHYGIGRIQRLYSVAQQACQFQSLLVIQPPEDVGADEDTILRLQLGDDDLKGGTYALVLECVLDDPSSPSTGGVSVHLSFDEQVVDFIQAEQMLVQLEHILHEICKSDETMDERSLSQLNLLSHFDRQKISAWNATVPPIIDRRMDHLIAERVEAHPDAPAICAWDGELTYRQFYDQARLLAYWLVVDQGIGPEVSVPICCAKSVWTPVAMLAVIIAGGVVVTMDPSQAVDRLRSITSQLSPRLVLASESTKTIADKLSGAAVHVVNERLLQNIMGPDLAKDDSWIPIISPDNALYVTFTSGSTGTPKGAVITHANACSAMTYVDPYIGFDQITRVLDLSSYSFDMVWYDFLHTFYAGGCLCVPSDDQRRNNIVGAIHDLRVNYLDITPSLARTLDPKSLPMIKKIVLGGEAVQMDDVTRWGPDVEIRNSYGPSECTVSSTVARYGKEFTKSVNIGPPRGLNAWVVSCLQPDRLVPIGAVGELVLEGPLVGRGYMNNPDKTAAAFISAPVWLSGGQIEGLVPRRHDRFYRTGDLVKSDSEGRLTYMGRIDTQVKLRGQRVELEEVEYHVRKLLPALSYTVAVEVVEIPSLQDSTQKSQRLVAFLSPTEPSDSHEGHSLEEPVPLSAKMANNLTRKLSQVLPFYMIPAAFRVLQQLPLSSAGKIDRKKLREIGTRIHLDIINQKGPVEEPKTDHEKALGNLWSEVLSISTGIIGRHDSFLELGGDSITAIRLVGAARASGLPLSVSLIFKYPVLEQMADKVALSAAKGLSTPSGHVTATDSAMKSLPEVAEVAKDLGVTEDMIAHILPVTEFQGYAVHCAFQKPRTEWNYFFMSFKGESSASNLSGVCKKLVSSLEILRAVFLPDGNDGEFVQVILRNSEAKVDIHRIQNESIDQACEELCMHDIKKDISPGSPFVNFIILQSENSEETRLVMGISHALYDAISLPRIAEYIGALYNEHALPPVSEFSPFVRIPASPSTFDHWRGLLQGAPLPVSVMGDHTTVLKPGKRTLLRKAVQFSHFSKELTVATIFTAAWGIALAQTTGKDDIVFGRGVSGRTLASSDIDIENVIGPCLNIAPVRMRLSSTTGAELYNIIECLQSQLNNSIDHETVGLSEIAKRCTDWPSSVRSFGSVIYFQNIKEPSHTESNDIPLMPIQLDRAEPPEPPRLNVLPLGDGQYTLELLVPEVEAAERDIWAELLERMVQWLDKAREELNSTK
jgi:amino acid adenylation domain-containing protein